MKTFKDDKENPFPASYQVRVRKEEKTPDKIESLAQQFAKIPGVEDVSYGQEWLTLFQIFRASLKTRPTASPTRSLSTLGALSRVLQVRGGFPITTPVFRLSTTDRE